MAKSAFLVCDIQQGIIPRIGNLQADYLTRLASTIDTARAAGVPIIYVIVRFRSGYPEASPRNPSFGAIAKMGGSVFVEGDATSEIHPAVAPRPEAGDIVAVKRRVSAFTGSDLEVVLRSLEATEFVICGLATSGVVLSTVRQGADLDYGVTVLRDLCGDSDEEVHRVLLDKVFPRQAKVVTADEWLGTIKK